MVLASSPDTDALQGLAQTPPSSSSSPGCLPFQLSSLLAQHLSHVAVSRHSQSPSVRRDIVIPLHGPVCDMLSRMVTGAKEATFQLHDRCALHKHTHSTIMARKPCLLSTEVPHQFHSSSSVVFSSLLVKYPLLNIRIFLPLVTRPTSRPAPNARIYAEPCCLIIFSTHFLASMSSS